MNTEQTAEDCHINDIDQTSTKTPAMVETEPLRFPLDSSMRIVFTGQFTGFTVEVRSTDEAALLYHMGCFGKGSSSRSKPRLTNSEGNLSIMRKRQYLKRNYWYNKFLDPNRNSDAELFLQEIEKLSIKVANDGNKRQRKDTIDLVSSDEELSEANDCETSYMDSLQFCDKEDTIVIVPNSDSEEENYFSNLKPKCCINKIMLQEKLLLTLQESFFLLYALGCLRIVHANTLLTIKEAWDLFVKTEKHFIEKYVVYHYFRSKGFVVKPGIKFGGDYLLYKDGPDVNHADYVVVIKSDSGCDWTSVLGHVRMATTTVKEILIAEVIKPIDHTLTFPENLKLFKVRELLLSRNIPIQ